MEVADTAAVRLWEMAHLGTPMAIRVAATLGVADFIDAGVDTVEALAEAVDADPGALYRLLRYLTKRGLLTQSVTGRFGLTELGTVLCDDHPSRLRAGLDVEGVGRAELAFVQLLHSVRTGEEGYSRQFGRTFWDDLSADPAQAMIFNGWMGADTRNRAAKIAAAYNWGALGDVVDVGGGTGVLAIALLREFPDLRATVVDLPGTAMEAARALAAAGLAGRSEVVGRSFFDPLPAGAAGYILSLVLHDWPDPAARELLSRCAEAAGPDGSVFVIENVGPDGQSPPTGMDLRMLVQCGGRERGLVELATVAASAGLGLHAVHSADSLAIVEFVVG